MEERATILDTGDKWLVGARMTINAPAEKIFNIIANPKMHPKIDGSSMVKGEVVGPDALELGSIFYMRMKRGVPYVMKNRVVEFKKNELIGWSPLVRNTWRYELKALDNGTTEVTQWMDGRKAPKLLMRREVQWSGKAMAKTLVNLKKLVESQQ